jgi:hypothetical protein
LHFWLAKSNDWLQYHTSRRQSICNRNGIITEIHTADEAHSNQISSFPQSSKYIVQQVRWYQAQIHFNQEAARWHIHKTCRCWQLFHFTQDAKWMVIISITLRFWGSVRMQASSSNSGFHLWF